jgi:CheY-like chemotaxis protein
MEPRKLLIVDDDKVNRMVAELFLRQTKWEVHQAENGVDALLKLHDGSYQCILLDISMPDISGLELCRRIRADERWRTARLVAYTAHALPDERSAIMEAGFDAILTKPAAREELIAAVGN